MPTNNANIGITYIDATTPPQIPSDNEVYFCKQSESIWVGDTQHSIGPLEHDISTYSFDDGIDSEFKKVMSTIVPVQAGSGTPSPTNVRAISGFTECTVLDISDSTNASYFMGLLKGTYDFVDLGTLNWTYQANLERMNCTSTIPNIKTPESNSDAFNGISPKYQSVSAFNIIYNNKCMAVNTTGELRIKDTDYTDATTFKTAMNGVYLIYELATPTTPTITDAQMQTLLTAFGYNGTTATISFGSAGTVYGARVELISGKLVVDRAVITDISTFTIDKNSTDPTNYLYYMTVTGNISNFDASNPLLICSHAPTVATPPVDEIGMFYSNNYRVMYFNFGELTNNTVAGFKSFWATNGIQLAYKLATPVEYQLTPAQLRSLVGTNNLTSSTGEVTEVEYIRNETISWVIDQI